MLAPNTMRFDRYEFAIDSASFRYITQSSSGPGWDFDFRGRCLNDNTEDPLFPLGARLLTEAAPMPLAKAKDLVLPLPYDEESGEPLFGLNVMEEHPLSDVNLRFAEKEGKRYRIEMTGTVAETVVGHPVVLELSAWAEELPDHAYPV
jgi:hypothetical protein